MKKFYSLIVLALITSLSFGQDPSINWQNKVTGDNGDYGRTMSKTADGGYIVCGYSRSNIGFDKTEAALGDIDYWVVKLDSNGDVQWDRTLGGSAEDRPASIIQTSDGGYLVGGLSISDASATKTEDGLGGFDWWVVKLDDEGNIEWDNTLGGTDTDMLEDFVEAPDGGYVLVGRSRSLISPDKSENPVGAEDYWVVKLDTSGDIVWDNTIGGLSVDYPYAIDTTADGGYVIAGYGLSGIGGDKTFPNLGNSDIWIVKINSLGEFVWDSGFGGSGEDRVFNITTTSDGGFVLNSKSRSPMSAFKSESSVNYDYWAVKLNSTGSIEWENTIIGNDEEDARDVVEMADGTFILGGYSRSDAGMDITDTNNGFIDVLLVQLSADGDLLGDSLLGGEFFDDLEVMVANDDGTITFVGESISPIGGDIIEEGVAYDMWVVNYENNFLSVDEVTTSEGISLYPNPTSNILQVSGFQGQLNYSIYNALGQNVMQAELGANAVIDVAALKSGLYFIRLEGEGQTTVRKFIKQ